MSILIDRNTPVIVQGITGKMARFHTEDMVKYGTCLLYTSPSPRDRQKSRMPSSA